MVVTPAQNPDTVRDTLITTESQPTRSGCDSPDEVVILAEFADLPVSEAIDLTETWLMATNPEEKRAVLIAAAAVREAIAPCSTPIASSRQ